MSVSGFPAPDELDELMLNAQLRDELEPYLDESVYFVDVRQMSTRSENEYLASMLAWERAPILPISKWFEPELTLPNPDTLKDEELAPLLRDTLQKLYDKKIVLEYTEHLSDRQLYTIIFRDILSAYEKKIDLPKNYLHWHCIDDVEDEETWLKYYASESEREKWSEENQVDPPPAIDPPFPRRLPRRTK